MFPNQEKIIQFQTWTATFSMQSLIISLSIDGIDPQLSIYNLHLAPHKDP